MPHSKLQTIFNGIKSTTLADVFIDRIVKVPDLDKLVTDAKAKSAVGGGSIRGIKQTEIVGGNATNIAYALVKFGSETELFAIGDEFTRRLLDLRFQEFDNIKINMLKGKPGFTIALETGHNNDSNIMISDVGGIEKFNGIDITTNYLKIIEESDIVIISNWASNLDGNQLVNEIFSTAKDSIKLLDFADLSTSTSRLQGLIDNMKNNKIIDMISLNENECQILGKFLGLKILVQNIQSMKLKQWHQIYHQYWVQ